MIRRSSQTPAVGEPCYRVSKPKSGTMAQRQQKTHTFDTFEDFLDWERTEEFRHELVDGVPVAMTGALEAHNVIQVNILLALGNKLRGGSCRPFTSDMIMKTGLRNGRYADVTVDCGPRNPANRSLPNPKVVFEILSPNTQREDRTVKLWEYNELRSIDFYVLIEQSLPLVLVYSRSDAGEFKLKPLEFEGLDGTITLPTIGTSLTMAEIYEGLDFNADIDPNAPPPTLSPWMS